MKLNRVLRMPSRHFMRLKLSEIKLNKKSKFRLPNQSSQDNHQRNKIKLATSVDKKVIFQEIVNKVELHNHLSKEHPEEKMTEETENPESLSQRKLMIEPVMSAMKLDIYPETVHKTKMEETETPRKEKESLNAITAKGLDICQRIVKMTE